MDRMARMATSPVRAKALENIQLLPEVIEFKEKFYPLSWAHYETALPGTFHLVPAGHVLESVRSDYRLMGEMIFGDVPAFDEILKTLQSLEDEINSLPVAAIPTANIDAR